MSFFTPKQHIFYTLFNNLNKDLSQIAELFEGLTKDFNNFDSFVKKAKELEHQGDKNTHAIIELLNKTFITPFEREDIYRLAGEMDDLIDLIENVIHNIKLYNITQSHPAFKGFAELINKASGCLTELLECLEKQKHTEKLDQVKIKMHNLEDEADELFCKSIAELFENHTNPITLIKFKDILETLENIMDTFQQVGDLIEGIIVKSS